MAPGKPETKAQYMVRLNEWIDAHLTGESYVSIAHRYGKHPSTVSEAVTKAIRNRVNATVDEARETMLAQADLNISVLMQRVIDAQDHYASGEVRKWVDMRAKLLGAYATPTVRVEQVNGDDSIDSQIAELTRQLASNDPSTLSAQQ